MEESFPRGKKRVFDEETASKEKVVKKYDQNSFDNLDNLFAEKPAEKLQIENVGKEAKRKKKVKGVEARKKGKQNKDEAKKGKTEKTQTLKTFKDDDVETVRGKPEKYDCHVLPGTLLIGVVKEVEPYLLKVCLPGGVMGMVPINEISVAYTQLLKTWTDSHLVTPEEEIFTLERMFNIGQVIRVKVLSTPLDKEEETLRLTLNPREVNMEITPGMLVKGLTLSGCVSSVEDHGYTVDIGIPGIVAFAPSKIEKDSGYRVGSYVKAVVKTSSPESLRSGESRHVSIQLLREIDEDSNKGILSFGAKRDFSALMPGHRLKGKITRTMKEGVRVSIGDGSISAHAHFTLLRNPSLKNYEDAVVKGTQLKFVVVGVNSSTKIIHLSDLPHLLGERKIASPIEDRFQLDEMLKLSVEWVLSGTNHVVFKNSTQEKKGEDAAEKIRAFYNEPVKNPLKFASSKKSAISCQVVGFALLENALIVKMKSEKATEFIAKLKSLSVGSVVKGVVKSYTSKGVVIQVNNPVTVLANLDWRNMDNEKVDTFEEVKSLHPIGSAISGRVLTVDVKGGGVSITCQPAMVESSLPILDSLQDAVINRVYAGSVCHIFENSDSALVKFFNGVTGILFLKQALYPIDLFFVGCPVLVKVTKIDLGQKKLLLHLEKFHLSYVNQSTLVKMAEGVNEGSAEKMGDSNLEDDQLGSVLRCVILRHSPRGALVRLPSGRLSILQRTHLSDFPEFFALLSSSLQAGVEISVVVLNGEMVSAKKELISYAEEHPSHLSWQKAVKDVSAGEDGQPIIESGKTYPLTVIEQRDFGFFAVLYNGCHAFVPNKLLTSSALRRVSTKSGDGEAGAAETAEAASELATIPPSSLFSVGQTLFGNVKLVEEEKQGKEKGNRIVVNTKTKYCDPQSIAKTKAIFANYLEEKMALGRGRGGEKVESVLSVKVLEVKTDWIGCSDNVIVEGAVNCPTPVTVGDSVKAKIIDYDPVGDTLYGSFIPALIDQHSGGEGKDEESSLPSAEESFLSVVLRVAAPRYVVVYRSAGGAGSKDAPPAAIPDTESGEKSAEESAASIETSGTISCEKSLPSNGATSDHSSGAKLFFVAAQKFYNDLESSRGFQLGQSLKVRFQDPLPSSFCLPEQFFRSREDRKQKASSSDKSEIKISAAAKTGNSLADQLLAGDMDMFYRVNPLELIELKQGSVIDAVVSSTEPTFIKVLINDRVPGRICRSEVGNPVTGAKPPKIKIGHHVKVRVVGVSKVLKKEEKKEKEDEPVPLGVVKPQTAVELSEKEKQFVESFVIECSARRDIVHGAFMASLHLSPPPLVAGRSVVGFVFSVDVASRKIVFKITHFCYAIVPFVAASKDPAALLRNPGRHFPVGNSVKIIIGRKLNGYCYDAALPGVLSSAVPRLKALADAIGEVSKVTPLWAHVNLVGGAEGRIHITDARDMYSRDPMSLMFYEGQMLKCFIKSAPDEDACFYSLSIRKSRLKNTFSAKDPEIRSQEEILPGSLIGAFVEDAQDGGGEASAAADETPIDFVRVFVSPSLAVIVKKENFPFNLTRKVMYPGKWVRVRILNNPALEASAKAEEDVVESVVEGSLKNEHTGVGELYLKQDELSSVNVGAEREKRKRTEITGSEGEVASPKKKRKGDGGEENKKEKTRTKKKRKRRKNDGEEKKSEGEVTKKDDDAEEEKEDNEEGKEKDSKSRLSLDNFSWDFDGLQSLTNDSHIERDDDDDYDDNDANVKKDDDNKTSEKKDDESKRTNEKSPGGKGSHSQMMAEESAIFAKEKLLSSDSTPSSAEDFERLLVASPDSSIVWIHYMSFRLQEAEVEKARAVAQRALETINYREEGEKMNIWVALLNLEMNYGTEDELLETFSRASRENDELAIKRHMAVIYASAGKHELSEKMYLGLIKKFPEEIQVWSALFALYFDQQKKEPARRLMERALQTLSTKFHIPVLTKVACLEFKSGDAERGRDVFERILSNFPKRLDVWTLYVDQLASAGDIEGGRGVLNRAAALRLGAAKMRTVFKKFLAFEKTHGSEADVEKVKTKAAEFVEKKRTEMQSTSQKEEDEDED